MAGPAYLTPRSRTRTHCSATVDASASELTLSAGCTDVGQVAATCGFNLSGSSRMPHTEGMIRLGTSADLAAASSVYRRASLSNAGDRDNLLAHPEYLILGPEGLAQGRTHVAEQDGSIVGFATWAGTAGTIELEDLFVDPAYMRRGIATALVSRITEILRARGQSAWRSPPILTRWSFTAPPASSTAASRKRTSAPRLAWYSCSPESVGSIRSRYRATSSMIVRPVGCMRVRCDRSMWHSPDTGHQQQHSRFRRQLRHRRLVRHQRCRARVVGYRAPAHHRRIAGRQRAGR